MTKTFFKELFEQKDKACEQENEALKHANKILQNRRPKLSIIDKQA